MNELLKPRIKVISDFWSNPFKVGDIIQFEYYRNYYGIDRDTLRQDWYTDFLPLGRKDLTRQQYALRGFKPYPHLFKEIPWWEDRQESEMPGYVKRKSSDTWQKVEEWRQVTDGINCRISGEVFWIPAKRFLPATEQEYLNQTKG